MTIMKNKLITLVILLSFFLGLKQACGETEEYLMAADAVKDGYREFALVYFLSELRNNPQSPRRPEALFACAEYYFLTQDYIDAFDRLKEFIQDYPDSKMFPVALLYLMRISQAWDRPDLAGDAGEQIINFKRIILLFKDVKEYQFRSPLGIDHKLLYYIDRIEFYSDGKIQAQILY